MNCRELGENPVRSPYAISRIRSGRDVHSSTPKIGVAESAARSIVVLLSLIVIGSTHAQLPTGLILDPTPAAPLQEFEKVSPKALPLSLDNRRLFGPARNQQLCGSCTVFSSTDLLEASLVRDSQLFQGAARLSEQLTIDCLAQELPNLCATGSAFTSVLGSLRNNGTTSSALPYVAGTQGSSYVGSFNACIAAINNTTSSNYAFRASDFAKIAATSVTDIKQAINTYGAVVASLYVTQSFQNYAGTGSVMVMQPCTAGCGWHAVVLLGWDDSRQAFLGRNSWGPGWGTGGYFYIAYSEVSRYSVSQLVVRENGVYVVRSAAIPFNYLAPTNPNIKTLTVAKSGSGSGTVASSVGGIDCGTNCAGNYAINTVVDLSATAASNSDFAGWIGSCQAGTPLNICRIGLRDSSVAFADFVAKPTTALDPRIVGIVGADFATRFAATPRNPILSVTPSTALTDEITRVDNLIVSDASPTIVFDRWISTTGRFDREANDKSLLLYAKQLTLDNALKGKTVTFEHKKVSAGTLDGINGPIGANGANGVGETNRNGHPGKPGAQGGKGQDGKSYQYPQVVIAFEQMVWADGTPVQPGSVNIRLDFQGARGGAGGNGGRGGNGGNGAQGKQGASGLFGCLEGPGTSGNGGDGGVGGLPGLGGDGGNGADIFTFSDFNQLPLFNGASLSLAGAAGGGGGIGGPSGSGGNGGPAAPGNGFCGPGRPGSAGNSPSANLGVGSTGAAGQVGSFVSYSLSQVSTAKASEPPVIEYVNTVDFPLSPGGHFFYTNSVEDLQILDSGAAGHFVRTGKTFRAGGSKQLCRFYGSMQPGPNSHFWSIFDRDCLQLRSLQVVPTPTDVQQWNYEGLAFSQTPPITTFDGIAIGCDSGLTPIYRYYNNAFQGGVRNAWDSNHRYGANKAELESFAQKHGWASEGIAFCAQPN